MKRLPVLLSALAVLLAVAVVGTGCSSTSTAKKTTTITLYDNYPENDGAALLAEAALRSVNSGYSGTTSFSFTGSPTAANVQPVLTYYGNCVAIQKALQAAHGSCTLSFNTAKNGSGTTLDFSTSDTALSSLLLMYLNNYTSVYAIYKY